MNKAIIMGRLTKEPELRYTQNNTPVCTFTLAVDRPFTKEGEERQADFIPVVAWGKLGESCGKYLGKGRRVAISGRIQTRTWDDTDGKKHYVTEIVAEEMHFADDKRKDGNDQGQQNYAPPQEQPPYQQPPAQQQNNNPPPSQQGNNAGNTPPWARRG